MTTPPAMPLTAVLDTAAAGPLRFALCRAIEDGTPLTIDGSAVERVGLACLQVLAAARAAAAAAGVGFGIIRPSTPLADMAKLAGLGALVSA
jgi:chemotaxis protein CheX